MAVGQIRRKGDRVQPALIGVGRALATSAIGPCGVIEGSNQPPPVGHASPGRARKRARDADPFSFKPAIRHARVRRSARPRAMMNVVSLGCFFGLISKAGN